MNVLDVYDIVVMEIASQSLWIKVLPGTVAIALGLLLIWYVENEKSDA